MVLDASLKEAARSLLGAKQRTILALVGIIIGIGSVIAMVSVGAIVEAEALRQFKEMGTEILTIQKGFGRAGGQAHNKIIKLEDTLKIPNFCPSISEVAPYIQGNVEIRLAGEENNGPLLGVTESFQDLNKIKIKKGRFISDLDKYSYFCVLGGEMAAKLVGSGMQGELIGKRIRAGNHIFTIIGILEYTSFGGMRPWGINEGMMIPITTAKRFIEGGEIGNIMARMTEGAHHLKAQDEILTYFKKYLGDINMIVHSAEELIERMEKQMKLFTLLLGSVGSISLIVGGVGVMNVMLVSVTERRKEIGIRRALGAKRGDIQSQFLIESIILSMVGGIFGIMLGVSASYIISYFSKWQFLISYLAIVLGFGVSSAVGIFFGFYPARQASRLDPITALRSE